MILNWFCCRIWRWLWNTPISKNLAHEEIPIHHHCPLRYVWIWIGQGFVVNIVEPSIMHWSAEAIAVCVAFLFLDLCCVNLMSSYRTKYQDCGWMISMVSLQVLADKIEMVSLWLSHLVDDAMLLIISLSLLGACDVQLGMPNQLRCCMKWFWLTSLDFCSLQMLQDAVWPWFCRFGASFPMVFGWIKIGQCYLEDFVHNYCGLHSCFLSTAGPMVGLVMNFCWSWCIVSKEWARSCGAAAVDIRLSVVFGVCI